MNLDGKVWASPLMLDRAKAYCLAKQLPIKIAYASTVLTKYSLETYNQDCDKASTDF